MPKETIFESIKINVCEEFPRNDKPRFWPWVGDYPIYDNFLYYCMKKDELRNQLLQLELRQYAKDKVVVDVGTGKDLIWAISSVEAGARYVYAIEEMESSYETAATKVKQLGLEKKIQVIRGNSSSVDLPEKADVCVSEIIGPIASSQGAVVTLSDVRARLLKPRAKVIPSKARTLIAPAMLPDALYDEPSFDRFSASYVEKLFNHIGRPFDFRLAISNFPISHLLCKPAIFEELNLENFDPPEGVIKIDFQFGSPGRLDGFLLWLNIFSSASDTRIDSLFDKVNWLPIFLPVAYPGISVSKHDALQLKCTTKLSEDKVHPDYFITAKLQTASGEQNLYCESRHISSEFRNDPLLKRIFL